MLKPYYGSTRVKMKAWEKLLSDKSRLGSREQKNRFFKYCRPIWLSLKNKKKSILSCDSFVKVSSK